MMTDDKGPTQMSALWALLQWFARAFLWVLKRGLIWGFVLLVVVMTGFRLFAPDDYWTSNPGWSYEMPLAFFYAILLAIWLQRRWSFAAWPFAFVFMTVAYISYLELWRSGYWAYRLTIDVETPEGVKSGSSIARVSMGNNDFVSSERARGCSFWSEATVVDLGARGRLIALLPRGRVNPCRVLPNLFYDPNVQLKMKDVRRFARLPPQTLTVPPEQWPIMIRFKEPSAPYYDAEELSPAALERSFGEGVQVKSVTVTILDAGYWPFNSWGWPTFLSGVEVPRSRILETIPAFNATFGQIPLRPGKNLDSADFVQGDSR